jgi:hypothetical protein
LTPHRFAVPFGQALDRLNECLQIDLFEPALSQEPGCFIGPRDKACVVCGMAYSLVSPHTTLMHYG